MKSAKQELLRARELGNDTDLVISDCPTGVWIVVYQGRTIQVRREHLYKDEKKYVPNCWTQRGGAARQAKALNELFHTDQFEIAEILGKTPD